MGLLLQGGSGNIANIQFEGGDGNKPVIIPKEGGKLATESYVDSKEVPIATTAKKQEARWYLNSTDWYYARKAETGGEVPTEVVTKRLEAREFLKANS